MAFYGVAEDAKVLAGGNDISTQVQAVVNQIIDTNIRVWGFGNEDRTEYQDVIADYNKKVIPQRYPLISTEEEIVIIDNINSDTPITVSSDCLRIDLESGIIKIIPTTSTNANVILSFTTGIQALKITYNYGYASVPTDIVQLANLLAAKFTESSVNQANADGLKALKIADYTETFDISGSGIRAKFGNEVALLFKACKLKYEIV